MREFLNKRTYPWAIAKWDEGARCWSLSRARPHRRWASHYRQRRSASAICTPGRGPAMSAGTPCASCSCTARCSSAPKTARSCRPKAPARTTQLGRPSTHTGLSGNSIRLHDGRRLGNVSGAAQSGDVDAGARGILQLGARAVRAATVAQPQTTSSGSRQPRNPAPIPVCLTYGIRGCGGQRQRPTRRHRKTKRLTRMGPAGCRCRRR